MMRIEKYIQKDGQTGWLAHISQKKQNRKSCALTRRFSSAQYGDAAFQKALAWAEDHQDVTLTPDVTYPQTCHW